MRCSLINDDGSIFALLSHLSRILTPEIALMHEHMLFTGRYWSSFIYLKTKDAGLVLLTTEREAGLLDSRDRKNIGKSKD
ncbi:hypothetical protein Nepgr_019100 [Nepenthes gracilis]|uniref:Uncharacterized protein n=1 Tax=Nepenthes gracilis TaxID=150966 RepID=A0AAD3SUT5_NEPGR|nr:hypothetical protein Nepgr_019100 [Nepenthes gracilis]